jgi:hypothetical protein
VSAHRDETGGGRSRRWFVVGALAAVAALALSVAAAAGPIGTASGFEDDDGNLVVNTTFDWNGFNPVMWTGTAPYRTTAPQVTSGWRFGGLEDAQNTGTDTAFSGGVKQDDDCASLTTAAPPNKDDLKRIYLSSKTVNNHVFLNLAWVRIHQNTTSASAHVGFEFNKGTTPCAGSSLVQRTAGDVLIVYDFEGGAGSPTLTLRRWITPPTNSVCEVGGNSSPPCWEKATDLTAAGFAEAKVNTGTTVVDTIGPSGTETLGESEFGEAGIDLTAAGVFPPGVCAVFGKVSAVSRSSGDSGTAQMKDLVGPGNVDIENCVPTTTTTGQKVVITDFARPTGFGTPTGTVTFQLFTNSSCTGTPLYDSGAVTLVDGLASATTGPLKTTGTDTSATFYWLVSYSGDANNLPSTSPCGTEQTTISGNTPGVDP